MRRVKGKAAWSIPTVSPPLLLHFVPAVSGRAVALAGDGHVTLFHVNGAHESEYQSVFQVSLDLFTRTNNVLLIMYFKISVDTVNDINYLSTTHF